MTENNTQKKLVLIREDGVEILDDELYNKIKGGNLSASMVNSLLACPADWVLDKYILPKLDHDEQPALERGTLFHSVMENFFRIPAGERTAKQLGQISKEVMEKDHPHLLHDEEAKAWLKNAVMGYLKMGFDFNDEVIPEITIDDKTQYGLELFLKDYMGDIERPVVGFVDKIVKTDNGLFIEDWKTGKTVHKYDPDKKADRNNSFDYWRQQTLYAMMLEKKGIPISGASLIFPVAKKIVEVDIHRKDVQDHVISDLIAVDERLKRCLDKNFFPFTPDIFCTWCHLLYNGRKKGRARFPKINQAELAEIVDFAD